MMFPYEVSAALHKFVSVLNVERDLTWDMINFIKKEMAFKFKILTEQNIYRRQM